MAHIIGANMTLTDTVLHGGSALLDGANGPTTLEINGTRYVYVASDDTDSVAIFTIDEAGELTHLDNIVDSGGLTLDGARFAKAFYVDGNPFLAVAGINDDGVTIFALTDSPPYATFADRIFDADDPANLNLNGAWTLSVTDTGSSTILTVAGYNDDGISTFLVGNDGTLTNVANIDKSDDPNYLMNGAFVGNTLTRFTSKYLVVGGEFSDGMSLFQVQADGTMTHRASIEVPGDYIEPTLTTGFEANSNMYIFGAGVSKDEVYLFKYDGFGTLELLERIPSPGLLDRVLSVQTIQMGDDAYFAVSSLSNEGITLFKFNVQFETLEFVQTLPDNTGQGELNRGFLSEAFDVGDKTFILAAGENDNAINVYEVGGGADDLVGTNLNDTIDGRGGDDTLSGLNGNDIQYGRDGDDSLGGGSGSDTQYGGSGDDILNGNSDNDRMDGGDGSDIAYGGSGNDTLVVSDGEDYSYGGSDTDILDFVNFNGGSGVRANLTTGVVTLPDGTKQSAMDFEDIYGTDRGDFLVGSEDGNYISALSGDDYVEGEAGADTLNGGFGDDSLYGGDGSDQLSGTDGNDNLNGGLGEDSIYGGNDADTLRGNEDNDVIDAGRGNDFANGGQQDDQIQGGSGDDTLDGANGRDTLEGGGGSDSLLGGNSNDLIYGGNDNDTIKGNKGKDDLYGDDGNDLITGGNQDDTLHGGIGADTLNGQNGFDSIDGGAGDDILDGGNAGDTLSGNSGNDELFGGDGKDVLVGGGDNDTLVGGENDDTLTGGSGADAFVFTSGWDADVITDFASGNSEVIDLSGVSQITDFDDLVNNHLRNNGGNAEIYVGANTILLEGVSVAAIGTGLAYSEDDFLF